MPRGHLRSSLLALMRRRHRARRPRRGKDGRAKPSIQEMTLIDLRPVEVQMRLIPGHWEGDLIIGRGNLSQVGTLVERTTLFVALVKLSSSKADTTAQAFTEILNRFDSQLRRSMTFDQGSEMRHHKTLTENTGVTVYFAHPHAPWERGISENTNGLLRPVPSQRNRPLPVFPGSAGRYRMAPQHPTKKNPGWKAPAELFLQKELSTSFNTGQLKSHLLTCTLNPPCPILRVLCEGWVTTNPRRANSERLAPQHQVANARFQSAVRYQRLKLTPSTAARKNRLAVQFRLGAHQYLAVEGASGCWPCSAQSSR